MGTVPPASEVDHLCGRPECVRPEHLQAVPWEEHERRTSTRRAARASSGRTRSRPARGATLRERQEVREEFVPLWASLLRDDGKKTREEAGRLAAQEVERLMARLGDAPDRDTLYKALGRAYLVKWSGKHLKLHLCPDGYAERYVEETIERVIERDGEATIETVQEALLARAEWEYINSGDPDRPPDWI